MILHDFMFEKHSFDQTSKYVNMWENGSPYGCPDYIKLKDVFCLPQLSFLEREFDNRKATSTSAEEVLGSLISHDIKILAINGPAGSGKTVLLSYWINQMALSETQGILVFTSFENNFEKMLFELMPVLSKHAKKEGLKAFTIVIEDVDFYYKNKNYQEQLVYRLWTITKRYPNLNFIITGRQLLTDALQNHVVYTNIEPFTHSQIIDVAKRVNKALRLEDCRADIEKIQDILGESNLSNPLILLYVLGNARLFKEINSISDFYCFLFDNPQNKEANQLASEIAWEMFKTDEFEIDDNSVWKYNEENPNILVNYSPGKLSFIHKSVYDFYLAKYITDALLSYCSNDRENHSKIRKMLGYHKIDADVLEYIKTLLGKNSNRAGIVHEKVIDSFEALLSDDLLITEGSFLKKTRSLVTVFYNQYSIIHNVFNSYEYISGVFHGKQREVFLIYLRIYSAFFKTVDFDFSNIIFTDCDFSGLDLSDMNLSGCCFRDCLFNNTNLSGASLNQASMRRVSLERAILKNADLSYADLHQTSLRGAILESANLSCAALTEADLRGVDLRNSNCRFCNFGGATLESSNLESSDCSQCNFSYADLRTANCSNCQFENSYFVKTNLIGTILADANFTDAVLEEVYIMK